MTPYERFCRFSLLSWIFLKGLKYFSLRTPSGYFMYGFQGSSSLNHSADCQQKNRNR